ncbi:hypothetical protein [Phyllobacterium leguminum]|uniref:Uncharacterized protein n=1 Tax=Phyllobacterium leguminum TaxID=314237 RepID=A0A318T0W6_9HYPH|nr:hypothetical protein [Phyllobacterium leguminum]PYE88137.1 hypothetical protein C7477_1087 [Phyllobacterium leguminum]
MRVKSIMLAGLVSVMSFPAISADPLASSQKPVNHSSQAKGQAAGANLSQEDWSVQMTDIHPPAAGCFQVSYPNTAWEEVPCGTAPSRHRKPPKHGKEVSRTPDVNARAGDLDDWILQAPGLISRATGSFPLVKGVTDEYDDVFGKNNYTLQLSTNTGHTNACGSYSNCYVWQQFAYDPAYYSGLPGGFPPGGLFIEYWMFGYDGECPFPWDQYDATTCVMDGDGAFLPAILPTELQNVKLSAYAGQNGLDGIKLEYKGTMYGFSKNADVLDISTIWNWSEFNVFGEGDASKAIFNPGSSLTVRQEAAYSNYKTAPPKCVRWGITAESNNLTLGQCTVVPYGVSSYSRPNINRYPYIEFTERAGVSAPCTKENC